MSNVNLFVNGDLTVEDANEIDKLTDGTVNGFIDNDQTVDQLKTLTGTNAYTIEISSADATGSTASEFNAINSITTEAINATAVTSLTHDSISDINTLLAAGNDPSLKLHSLINFCFVFDVTQY